MSRMMFKRSGWQRIRNDSGDSSIEKSRQVKLKSYFTAMTPSLKLRSPKDYFDKTTKSEGPHGMLIISNRSSNEKIVLT